MEQISFHDFGDRKLAELLGLQTPKFIGAGRRFEIKEELRIPFRQLNYISKYVGERDCKTVVLEAAYTDRHHMEDHSAYYSKSFRSYPNVCQRIHFFTLPKEDLQEAIDLLHEKARGGNNLFRQACLEFSEAHYLGFCVIKPLHGSPVGRTVLRCYPETELGKKRVYPAVHPNLVHLMGVPLTVSGIAFQQQDFGVSACATTAIWSALHYLRGAESIATPTPVQITRMATQNHIPIGRAMPSEGLTAGQMCGAIHMLGIAPCLNPVRFRGPLALAVIHAAVKSEMVPILIMRRACSGHAVALTGMKLESVECGVGSDGIVEPSRQVIGFHLHDDRRGPYMTSSIISGRLEGQSLELMLGRLEDGQENWEVMQVLVPMYPKINLSLVDLRSSALEIAKALQGAVARRERLDAKKVGVEMSFRFVRGFKYVESLILEGLHEQGKFLSQCVHLPRYVGLVTLKTQTTGRIDLLLDSTETRHNTRCLAVISHQTAQPSAGSYAREAAEYLSKRYC